MADFRYNNNAIRNQKKSKPIANGNVADRGMIALTDEPLPFWKTKTEWKFKCKYWTKKLINCCFYQNIRKHKLTAYLMYQCYFFSYLYKYLHRYWANQLDFFVITSTKKAIFTATLLKKHYGIPILARLPLPHFQKTWKVQCKLREVNVIL